MAFSEEIDRRRIRIPNRPDIFGHQLVMNGQDEVVEEEPDLLSNATTVTVDEAPALAEAFGGVCYPAHIDRQANGIIATLGFMPPTPRFTCVEFHDGGQQEAYRQHVPPHCLTVVGSDAHLLWDIRDAAYSLELPDEPYSSAAVRQALIDTIRRGL